jgi:hypothetical protein
LVRIELSPSVSSGGKVHGVGVVLVLVLVVFSNGEVLQFPSNATQSPEKGVLVGLALACWGPPEKRPDMLAISLKLGDLAPSLPSSSKGKRVQKTLSAN